jgi:hypothetical protein
MSCRHHDMADKIQVATDQHAYASSCKRLIIPQSGRCLIETKKPRVYTNPSYGICTTYIWKFHLLWVRCKFTQSDRGVCGNLMCNFNVD